MAKAFIASAALFALTGQPVMAAKKFSKQDLRDATCATIYAYALGNLSEDEQDKATGLTGIVSYFVGKLHARNPNLSMKTIMTPEFTIGALNADEQTREKCRLEGTVMTDGLLEAGQILEAAGI